MLKVTRFIRRDVMIERDVKFLCVREFFYFVVEESVGERSESTGGTSYLM